MDGGDWLTLLSVWIAACLILMAIIVFAQWVTDLWVNWRDPDDPDG